LAVFYEDIAETMVEFPEVDLGETKREIFSLVNEREIELLKQKQIPVQALPHHCQQDIPSCPVHHSDRT
jgi:hypothetical protein